MFYSSFILYPNGTSYQAFTERSICDPILAKFLLK